MTGLLVALVALAMAVVAQTPEAPPAPVAPAPSVQRFDPRDVDELGAAAPGVAPLLPDVLAAPDGAPFLADHPLSAAVLAVREDDAVHLLGVDGSWRRVPPPGRGLGAELTRDGTRLAVHRGDEVVVWDLPTGGSTRLREPLGHRPWDYTAWRWVDRGTLLLDDADGGWLVDVATGAAQRVPYPSSSAFWWTVGPGGAVVESADWSYPNLLTDWSSGRARQVDMAPTGRLMWPVVDADTVVGASYDDGPFAVYVADRADLAPRHVLRVHDHDANYSNGGLSVLALLPDGTVLLRVAVFSGPGMQWRLVAWEPASGGLSVVTRAEATVPLCSVAEGLLG